MFVDQAPGGCTRRGAMVAAAEEGDSILVLLVAMGFQTAAAAVEGVGGVGKGITISSEEGLFMDSLRLVMLVVLLLLLARQDFSQGFQARPAGHGSRGMVC